MSHRLVRWCAATCVVLVVPAVSQAQNKNCCCNKSSSMTTSRPSTSWTHCTPSRTALQNPLSPATPANAPNLPVNLRRGNQPRISLSRQADPQLQQGVTANLLMQQTMMQEQLLQYQLQDQVKQQLLMYAIDAPTENLQRELKNSNAFVRWAASVELNRRWRLEKAVADAEARVAKAIAAPAAEPQLAKAIAVPPADAPPAAAPRRTRTETPALVSSSSNDQSLLLQYGVPNSQ